MKKIRLEINSLELDRPKKRWELYFVIATEDPNSPEKTLITIAPHDCFIQYERSTENYYTFKPEGNESNGMYVFERKMPKSKSIKAKLWLIHSRDKVENIEAVMEKITNAIEGEKLSKKSNPLGENPWISVEGFGMDIIAGVLKDSKDKQMGTVVLDENDLSNIKDQLDYKNVLSTEFGSVEWSWIVK